MGDCHFSPCHPPLRALKFTTPSGARCKCCCILPSMDGEPDFLNQLDKLPKIRQFDAFPKTQPIYTQRSAKGGIVTIAVALCLLIMGWNEARDYFFSKHRYSFEVDSSLEEMMQINFDVTVAMQCHYLTVDLRDAVGDRSHVSDIVLKMDGTTFDLGNAGRLDKLPDRRLHVGDTISKSKKKSRGISFSRDNRPSPQKAFRKTEHIVENGPACRMYGSILAKRVTGNLHVTTLGHGYFSWEHTDHKLMNLSHVFHELSFGPYFPEISQPLDSSVETTNDHFGVFEYFVSIIPTTFIDRYGRRLQTNQYSVNDYARTIEHGMGVPGIFIKFEVEPFAMTIRERAMSLTQFLVRLAGILGGVWVCAGFGYRIGDRMLRLASKMRVSEGEPSYQEYAKSYSSGYASRPSEAYHHQPAFHQRYGQNDYGNGFREKSAAAFHALGGGASHRPTPSMQQGISSEEGQAPW